MKNLRNLCCLLLVVSAAHLHAEALVKPLPTPDTSKLAPDVAKQLAQARANFDKEKVNLESNTLAVAYAEIGALYFRTGMLDVADIAFYDATQLAPNDARWIYLRGVLASGVAPKGDRLSQVSDGQPAFLELPY